jgi:cytidine deaminase
MKIYALTKEDKELIQTAKDTIKKVYRKTNAISVSVGSSLKAKSGRIYSGVNIRSRWSPPTSICAETGAISQMVTNNEENIDTIVAVHEGKIIPPCGACRHIISQFGNPFVIISNNKKVKISELYPIALVEKKT